MCIRDSLGDNAYSYGLSHESRKSEHAKARRVLDLQIAPALRSSSKAIFIPGNHDWSHGRSDGWETIKRQGEFVNSKISNGGRCPEHIEMVRSLSEILSKYDLDICAAGHDHSLQVIKSENKVCDYYLVSGSLSKPEFGLRSVARRVRC